MNLNETILQKLEEMADRQKARDAEIEARQKERHEALETRMTELEARQKERHEVLETRITNIDTEVKDIRNEVKDSRKDNAEMKVHQTKLEGDLQLLDSDLKGQLGRLETKFDAFIANMRDQKADTNERWKVGGIIVSCGIAVVSLVLSILTRFGK